MVFDISETKERKDAKMSEYGMGELSFALNSLHAVEGVEKMILLAPVASTSSNIVEGNLHLIDSSIERSDKSAFKMTIFDYNDGEGGLLELLSHH